MQTLEQTREFGQYIDGRWRQGGPTFETRNPATGEVVGRYAKGTPADVDAAVQAAAKAFKSWRLHPAPRRGEIRRMFGQLCPAELPNKWAMAVRKPLGVVAAITPWNFPMAIPTWKIMPALVAGNTVVFKPSSETPHLAAKLVELFAEAGLPPGVVNLVYGS